MNCPLAECTTQPCIRQGGNLIGIAPRTAPRFTYGWCVATLRANHINYMDNDVYEAMMAAPDANAVRLFISERFGICAREVWLVEVRP